MKKTPVLNNWGGRILLATGENGTRILKVESEYRFAFDLKNAARVMANYARKTRTNDIYSMRAFVTGAITLSYSYLEAALNEFIYANAVGDESPLTEEQKAAIRALRPATTDCSECQEQRPEHTLEMFNKMLRLADKPAIDPSKDPYQAANLVRSLRNLLVHPVPGWVVTHVDDPNSNLSEQQKIVRQLRAPLGLDRDATFPVDVLTSRCATWAVDSCERFMHQFVINSQVDPGFVTSDFYDKDGS